MSIESLLNRRGISWKAAGQHKNVRSGFIGIDCPQCGRYSGHYHLGISLRSLGASCWRCGRMSAWKALQQLGVPPDEIKELFDNRIVLPQQINPRGELKPPRDVGPLRAPHINHLKGRRISRAAADLWRLGGIGRLGGNLSWRLYVPIFWKGDQVSWTTRSTTDEGMRWIAAKPEEERLSSAEILYGWDHVRDAAILVEGPGDCWRGGAGFCCALGLKLSNRQLELLASVPRRGICLDREPAAQKKALQFAEQLSSLPGETIICELEHGSDPGDAPNSELEELRKEILR